MNVQRDVLKVFSMLMGSSKTENSWPYQNLGYNKNILGKKNNLFKYNFYAHYITVKKKDKQVLLGR